MRPPQCLVAGDRAASNRSLASARAAARVQRPALTEPTPGWCTSKMQRRDLLLAVGLAGALAGCSAKIIDVGGAAGQGSSGAATDDEGTGSCDPTETDAQDGAAEHDEAVDPAGAPRKAKPCGHGYECRELAGDPGTYVCQPKKSADED